MKRLIAFRLDEFTYNELQKHLEESKQGVSDFIRIAIYEKLERIENAKIMPIDKQKH
ncbi:MAG TPA: hypothetical protein IAC14_08800 [Candidatus Scybalomonas excrementigallinarum]|nr:hypothetical protein [Candidatus Scybalomonas excrementigallinarum]